MTDKLYDVTVRVVVDLKFEGSATSPSLLRKTLLRLHGADADLVNLALGTFGATSVRLTRTKEPHHRIARVCVRKAK